MSFTAPLGLLALLAVPAVLALHSLRRRFRRRRVAGLFLFAPDTLAAAAGRKRTRLLRTASLWLELAAALLVALWLGGLTFGIGSERAHVVLVIDDSASMAAVTPSGSVADRVRAEAATIIGGKPSATVFTVVLTGRRPEVLAGPEVAGAAARDALARWRPRKSLHDVAPAWSLGLEIAGEGGEPWFLTDTPQQPPPRYHVRALGAPAPNAAVLGARRTASGPNEKVFVELGAFGTEILETELAVRVDAAEEPVLRRRVALEPGHVRSVAFEMPRTGARMTVTLADDALAIDNAFELLAEPRQVVRVCDLLGDERSRLMELRRALGVVPGTRVVTDPAAAHLVFTTGAGRLPEGRTEVVIAPAFSERDTWVGPFLLDRRHPVLDGVTLDGVLWTAGSGDVAGLPIVSAGRQTLIAEERAGDARRLRLNVDPARSNLATSPDWPILVANVVEWRRERLPGPTRRNVRAGDLIGYRFTGPAGGLRDVRLVTPDGASLPARGIGYLTWEARVPGRYRIEGVAGGSVDYAVAFVDPKESDLTGCGEEQRAAVAAPAGVDLAGPSAPGRAERLWFALLFLLVVAADWWVLGLGRNP